MTRHLRVVPNVEAFADRLRSSLDKPTRYGRGYARTYHDPVEDPIAKAIMSEPFDDAPSVQVLVGEQRWILNHWKMVTDIDASHRLQAAWEHYPELPPLREPMWWRLRSWWNT